MWGWFVPLPFTSSFLSPDSPHHSLPPITPNNRIARDSFFSPFPIENCIYLSSAHSPSPRKIPLPITRSTTLSFSPPPFPTTAPLSLFSVTKLYISPSFLLPSVFLQTIKWKKMCLWKMESKPPHTGKNRMKNILKEILYIIGASSTFAQLSCFRPTYTIVNWTAYTV